MKSVKKAINYLLLAALVSTSYLGFAKAITWPNQSTSFDDAVGRIINWVFGLAGVIFVIMFLYGGIQYMTSGGNEEGSQAAKKLLVNAVIGMVIVALCYVIANYVVQHIGGNISF